VKLLFILVYKGRKCVGEPVSLLVRIEAHAWVGPELPTVTLHIGDRRLELMSPNRRHQLVYPCPPSESCAFNGVVSALTGEELRLISNSSVMSGQVFGKYLAVSVAGARAVRSLVALLDSVR